MIARTQPERFFLSSRDFEPAYMALYRSGELHRRAETALERLKDCQVCPRDCHVDRLADKKAACKTGRYALVGSYFPHFGEEDCLRGWNGSGTIFFSLCNLRCVFCFHPDTLIASDEGLVRIADVFERGEGEVERDGGYIRFLNGRTRVLTRQGKWASVAKAFQHGFAGELVVLKPFNCPALMLTPNHEVFAIHKSQPENVVKIRAEHLSKDYYLLVPKRTPTGLQVELNLCELMASELRHFRKTPLRRMPFEELTPLFAQKITSREIANATGYHPAYVRKLRGLWRNHLLSTDDPEWVVNEVIEEDGLIRFRTERGPGIPAQITLDERLAWLLGIYCAEGHVTSSKDRPNSHRLVFSFGHHEIETAERVEQLIYELFGVQLTRYQRRTTITVEVGKASLALLFSQLCGKGARNKQVPSTLRQASREVIQAFLDGIFEGDGCDRGTHQVINTISEKLALGLFEIGLVLGMLPSFHKWQARPKTVIEGREVNQSPLYYVKFPKVNPMTQRRHTRWKETPDYFLIPIHKLERVPYDGMVFNLEIDDPDHSYAAPFVAVSNCQNYDISQAGEGAEVRPERLASMMLDLQAQGCHNINFVTPEHVVPQLLEGLAIAVERGLRLPIVYNTSAYDSLDSLHLMDGIVDIYMPDFKFWDAELSLRYLKAKDYAEAARRAIQEMHRQVGDLKLDEDGLAKRGVLVRHLVMPGQIAGTTEIMRFLVEEVSPDTYVNVMAQYYPAGKVSEEKYAEINRHVTNTEYLEAVKLAQEAGLWRFDTRRTIRPRW